MSESLLIFSDGIYCELPAVDGLHITGKTLPLLGSNELHCQYQSGRLYLNGHMLNAYAPVDIDDLSVLLFREEEKLIPFGRVGRILIGAEAHCDICIPNNEALSCVIEPDALHLEHGCGYLNGKAIQAGDYSLCDGDCLFISGYKITVRSEHIMLSGNLNTCKLSVYDIGCEEEYFEGFPVYKRAPRIIKRLPDENVSLTNPQPAAEKKKGQLAKLIIPPTLMLAATITVSILMPRGLYALIGIFTTLTSTVMSVTNYFNEQKDTRIAEKERSDTYQEYLLRQCKALDKLKKQQIEALNYHYPAPADILRMANAYSSRIYERSSIDDDFLSVTIGNSIHTSSYNIAKSSEDVKTKKDDMLAQVDEIVSEFSHIDNLPTVIDLKKAHLGIVGDKRFAHEQIKLLVHQLAFFQSYHEIEIVCLFHEKYRCEYEWMQWYPHCKIKAINITGIIDSESVRDQVLGNLTQVLKQRRIKLEDQKKESVFLPHLVFIIDEPALVINHSIMEYLQQKESNLGFSLVYTTDMMASLPENIKTVLQIGDAENAVLVLNEGRLLNRKIKLESAKGLALNTAARALAALTHVQGVSTQIPDSITFFEMFGISHPDELQSEVRWKENSSHKSLAVPLGVRAKDDYVLLNLHEKAHGPHGLVAGTTGSGKSEIIQSYILSLAVNFHPYEVGFLLIDYKGGGMAGLFKNLPHLLGMITNLDGSESMRAMASIKSELSRRQKIFSENNVNHINQYNKLFKSGKASKPLPHLFLISDEFAELKKEQPEFMSELVSAARIGRSLGIHLILATQKPTGVVDDQIWSNSKFKLALKVQDASDSNEVLKTPDAASITLPGRAYLQVGNNEIYELFQSAWSGANYRKQKEESGYDERVYLVNKLGQRQILNEDLSQYDGEESSLTQLDVVVDYLSKIYSRMAVPEVERPWHPPLPKNISSPHIGDVSDVASFTQLDSVIELGLIDIPEQQRQEEFCYDFVKDGNLAIFSSSGFGKSTTLTTIILSLAVKNSPELLRFFLIDLGNAALGQMRGLPHTADYIAIDDTDKLEKLVKLINEEMQERKALLASKNALNFSMFNSVSDKKMEAIIIVIDNYDVIRELGHDLEDFWTRLTRDGAGVGIYVIASATRSNAFKYVVLNNFKKKIAHHLIDNNDLTAIIGRTPYALGEQPGRAFIKYVNINMMQVYTAVAYENDMTYASLVGNLVDAIKSSFSGEQAQGIRMLPDILDYNLLMEYSGEKDIAMLPVGLDFEEIQVQHLSLANPVHLILGTAESGKTNVLRLLLASLITAERIFLVDSKGMELGAYEQMENVCYSANAYAMAVLLEELRTCVENRKSAFETQSLPPRQFYASLQPVCVVIDDFDNFIEQIKLSKVIGAEALIKDSMMTGISYIATSLSSRMKGFDDLSKQFKEATSGIILGSPMSQTVWQVTGMSGYRSKIDSALLYRKGEVLPIKVPLIEEIT